MLRNDLDLGLWKGRFAVPSLWLRSPRHVAGGGAIMGKTHGDRAGSASTVLDEHKRMSAHLEAVDEWAAEGVEHKAGWRAELAPRTGTLVEHLKVHFSSPAEAGVFDDMQRRTPHLLDKLSSLTREHATILAELRDLAELAARAGGPDGKKLAAKARAIVASVRRHKSEENELILRGMYDDLGGLD